MEQMILVYKKKMSLTLAATYEFKVTFRADILLKEKTGLARKEEIFIRHTINNAAAANNE